ncbi:MAG: cytochrome c [Candidatus Binatia bacterium]
MFTWRQPNGKRRVIRGIAGVTSAILVWLAPGIGFAQDERVVANGKRLYQWYCEFCHGAKGKGDGPLSASLTVKPADLTQIRKKHEGKFPFWETYRQIEGEDGSQQEVRGHGSRAMPIWGAVFQRQEKRRDAFLQEELVIGRLLSLLYYLESIQE